MYIIILKALKNMYQLVATNLELAQRKKDTMVPTPDIKLKEGDLFYLGIIQLICGT